MQATLFRTEPEGPCGSAWPESFCWGQPIGVSHRRNGNSCAQPEDGKGSWPKHGVSKLRSRRHSSTTQIEAKHSTLEPQFELVPVGVLTGSDLKLPLAQRLRQGRKTPKRPTCACATRRSGTRPDRGAAVLCSALGTAKAPGGWVWESNTQTLHVCHICLH